MYKYLSKRYTTIVTSIPLNFLPLKSLEMASSCEFRLVMPAVSFADSDDVHFNLATLGDKTYLDSK